MGLLFAITLLAGISVIGTVLMNSTESESDLSLTLLYNAGVMIESENTRIYIDPYRLNDTYIDYPADIILVTHPHGNHYHPYSISKISTDSTVFIFPENMSSAIEKYGGVGLNPGDSHQTRSVSITAFYLYTYSVEGFDASHPRESNWISYIIDIEGFCIFHGGDSKNIPSYTELTEKIDVALLPLGPGCQTMYRTEVLDAIEVIQPNYFIPIHYTVDEKEDFMSIYETEIADLGCQCIDLDYYESFLFQNEI